MCFASHSLKESEMHSSYLFHFKVVQGCNRTPMKYKCSWKFVNGLGRHLAIFSCICLC